MFLIASLRCASECTYLAGNLYLSATEAVDLGMADAVATSVGDEFQKAAAGLLLTDLT